MRRCNLQLNSASVCKPAPVDVLPVDTPFRMHPDAQAAHPCALESNQARQLWIRRPSTGLGRRSPEQCSIASTSSSRCAVTSLPVPRTMLMPAM
jgi:hypothetical protein